MAYVYILQSLRSGKYYIGSTKDLKRRLNCHNAAREHTGKSMGPFELKFSQEFSNIDIARKAEKKLKSYKRRDFIKKIIRDGWFQSFGPIAQSVRATDS